MVKGFILTIAFCATNSVWGQEGNRTPVQADANIAWTNNQSVTAVLYTVPAGKRLTIEYASHYCVVPDNNALFRVMVRTVRNGNPEDHDINPTFRTSFADRSLSFGGGQSTKWQGGAGTQVSFVAYRNTAGGSEKRCVFSFSGYLETE